MNTNDKRSSLRLYLHFVWKNILDQYIGIWIPDTCVGLFSCKKGIKEKQKPEIHLIRKFKMNFSLGDFLNEFSVTTDFPNEIVSKWKLMVDKLKRKCCHATTANSYVTYKLILLSCNSILMYFWLKKNIDQFH